MKYLKNYKLFEGVKDWVIFVREFIDEKNIDTKLKKITELGNYETYKFIDIIIEQHYWKELIPLLEIREQLDIDDDDFLTLYYNWKDENSEISDFLLHLINLYDKELVLELEIGGSNGVITYFEDYKPDIDRLREDIKDTCDEKKVPKDEYNELDDSTTLGELLSDFNTIKHSSKDYFYNIDFDLIMKEKGLEIIDYNKIYEDMYPGYIMGRNLKKYQI